MHRFALLLLIPLVGCAPAPPPDELPGQEVPVVLTPEEARNARFGMPSAAKAAASDREDFLIERPQYVLSYNAQEHRPNWVSWRLRQEDVGSAARAAFEPDPMLPKHFAHVTSHVYDGSGFDRGHMCPAKDRSASNEDMAATFYLTNVVPQSPASNQKGWERLERYCRDLVKKGHELHIACGPHGIGGTGRNGFREEVGKGRVKIAVPAKLWKVIMVLPHEGADPRKNTRVIAIIMPNDQTVGFDWTSYRVTTRDVQELTGYTFFRNLPPYTAAVLRSRVDDVEVHVGAR